MKKLGCAKCGGTKKMKLGGSAVAKAPVNIFGIPQQNLGTSGQSGNMKKGGTTKVHPLVAFQKFNNDRNKKLAKAEVGMSTGYLGKPVSQSPSNKYIIDANYRKVATPSNSPRSGKIAVKSSNPGGIPKGIDKPVRTNNSKTSASPIKSANPTREPRIKFGDPMAGIPASKPKPKGRYEDAVESNSTRTKAAVKSVSSPIKSNGPGTPASRTAAIPKSSVKTPVQHTSGYTPKRGATTPVKKTVGPRPSVDEMREANIKKYSVLKSKIAEDKKPKSRNTAAEFKAGMVASPVATVAKKVYGMMKKNGGKVKKPLPKAQLGSIVKTFTKFAKPVAKNIIKDTKVVVRPVNRSVKPVAKKLDRKVADKFIVNKSHAKNYRDNDRNDLKALKIFTAVGAAPMIGAAVKGSINKPKDTSKVKVKPKKK